MKGQEDVLVNDLQLDSRQVQDSDAFIAIKGQHADGHDYIEKAIANGASVVICQKEPILLSTKVTYVITKEIHENLWVLAAGFYGNPSDALHLIGVTGTNGKTTVSTMFFDLMRKMGKGCGLISTVNIRINEEVIPTNLTTPDVVTLNRIMAEMVRKGCDYAVMEVSSHAIAQNRIKGLDFDGGVFTNITHDHLDYHKTFKDYLNTKKMFFDLLDKSAFALTNVDDRNGEVMLQNTKAKKVNYGLRKLADYKAKVIEHDFSGMHLQINKLDFYTRMVGRFNAYNLLAVIGIADQLGFETMEVLQYLSELTSVEGRFDLVHSSENNVVGIVDYAHTPDALENVLQTIHQVNKQKLMVITVVGCGGDRDKTKRPLMADIATRYSDMTILTSDNPRTEDPEVILDEMEIGVQGQFKKNYERISNRKEAIHEAAKIIGNQGIILVAGKGHEKYQDIQGVKHPFDDKKILQEIL